MTETQIIEKIKEITGRTNWPYVYATKIDPKMTNETRENLDKLVKNNILRRSTSVGSYDNYRVV